MARQAAIIGGGIVGGGWAARFLLMGWDVRLYDPNPDCRTKVEAILDDARRSLPGLSDVALPPEGSLTVHNIIAEAVAGTDWIQVCTVGNLASLQDAMCAVQTVCPPDAILGCAIDDYPIAALQETALHPGQILIAHACDPVYLLPLVELIASAVAQNAVVDRAAEILTSVGMHPLRVWAPIGRHLQDALQLAAAAVIHEGSATPQQIDDVIRDGFGLSWAHVGLSGISVAKPRDRDEVLVTLLRGLKARNRAAGAVLNAHDRRLDSLPATLNDIADLSQPVTTLDRAVPLDWTDYNGHMNEARYLQAFGDATDRMMALVGCDMDYVASGVSFFTAETHIRHVDEVQAGTRIRVKTQVLLGQGKKMHLFHKMFDGDRLLATGEHMLIHVDLTTRKAADPDDRVAQPLALIGQAHATLPWPDGVGRTVGRK